MRNLWLNLREIKWLSVLALIFTATGIGVVVVTGTLTVPIVFIGAAIVLALLDRD